MPPDCLALVPLRPDCPPEAGEVLETIFPDWGDWAPPPALTRWCVEDAQFLLKGTLFHYRRAVVKPENYHRFLRDPVLTLRFVLAFVGYEVCWAGYPLDGRLVDVDTDRGLVIVDRTLRPQLQAEVLARELGRIRLELPRAMRRRRPRRQCREAEKEASFYASAFLWRLACVPRERGATAAS